MTWRPESRKKPGLRGVPGPTKKSSRDPPNRHGVPHEGICSRGAEMGFKKKHYLGADPRQRTGMGILMSNGKVWREKSGEDLREHFSDGWRNNVGL